MMHHSGTIRTPRRPLISLIRAVLVTAFCSHSHAGGAAPAALPQPVAHALTQAGIAHANVAIWVQPVDADRPSLAINATQAMNPASVMKLVTTFAALERLGPGHIWETRVLARGAVAGGVLHGDLAIVGGGDPMMDFARLWKLLRLVKAQGIREIRGDILLDGSVLAIPPHDPARFDGRGLRPYNSGPAGLLMHFNTLNLSLIPPDQPSGTVTVGLAQLPLINTVYGIYTATEKVVVEWLNQSLFHIKDALVPIAGSGETSFGYAELCFHSLMAVVGTALWSLLDRKRPSYETAYYWLIVGLRYYVSMVSFVYGIIKVYAQQMPFPNLSQFATPLGELSPMRLAWFFIGYSQPYEVFSGVMECVAGALLIFRRTSTLGALVAAGVFLNVAMMNLAYNIPVKLFSMHLFVFSCILLFTDAQRLLRFFVLNQPTEPLPPAYVFSQKWIGARATGAISPARS